MSRSETKDAAARAALVPLREGERPVAVTIGAVVAFLFGLSQFVGYAAGLEVAGERPRFYGVAAFGGLMFVAAWGMWRAKYWAVLGLQVLLVFFMLAFSYALLRASSVLGAVIGVAGIVGPGFLFWFLVKALARIQMPERRPR